MKLSIWGVIGSFLVAELLAAILYAAVAQVFLGKYGLDFRGILKGALERVFLTACLYLNYPHALTLFSALKLATRLKHIESSEGSENKFNDYYLVGNLISVMLALLYVWTLKHYGPFQ